MKQDRGTLNLTAAQKIGSRRRLRLGVPTAVEAALACLILYQVVQLLLAALTSPPAELRQPVQNASVPRAALAGLDPFFRLVPEASGAAASTNLQLKLNGVRQDLGSGEGSAIITLPDGQQRSFGVGEEIVPGVTLKSVGEEGVTLSNAGVDEQLVLEEPAPGEAAQ